jgi:hypothetical protein
MMSRELDDVFLLDTRHASILHRAPRRPRYNFFNGDYHPMTGGVFCAAGGGAALFLLGLAAAMWASGLHLSQTTGNAANIPPFMALVGAGCLAAAVYFGYATVRTQRQFARLETQGILLQGRIQTVTRASRGFPVVHYFFIAPDGKTLRGTSTPQYIQEMPRSGMSVVVLYGDETCYRVL